MTDRELLIKIRDAIDAQLSTPACFNCEHLAGDDSGPVCQAANDQPIPTSVLATGCEMFIRDIPF